MTSFCHTRCFSRQKSCLILLISSLLVSIVAQATTQDTELCKAFRQQHPYHMSDYRHLALWTGRHPLCGERRLCSN